MPAPCLIIKARDGSVQRMLLQSEKYIIGRDNDVDIRLAGPKVSRRHAQIFRRDGRYFLEDLGSSNGIFNGTRRLHGPVALGGADSAVRIADYEFTLDAAEPAPPLARLVGVSSDIRGRQFPLLAGEHEIGRDEGLSIVLADPSVSRRHARLTVTPSDCVVTDLDSRNGTFVNGKRIKKAHLGYGGELRVGKFLMRLKRGRPRLSDVLLGVAARVTVPRVAFYASLATCLLTLSLWSVLLVRDDRLPERLANEDDEVRAEMRDAADRAAQEGDWGRASEHMERLLALSPLSDEVNAAWEGLSRRRASAQAVERERVVAARRASYLDEARKSCETGRFHACHDEAVKLLRVEPTSRAAQSLAKAAESAMQSQRTVLPWELRIELSEDAELALRLWYPTLACQELVAKFGLAKDDTSFAALFEKSQCDAATTAHLRELSGLWSELGATMSLPAAERRVALERLSELDSQLLPAPIASPLRRHLEEGLATVHRELGEAAFDRGLNADAFVSLKDAAAYGLAGPQLEASFIRLEERAQNTLDELQHELDIDRRCAKLQDILAMTRPSSQTHKDARRTRRACP